MRGIVIAGTHSGCGKTTVTLGILAALRKKGLTVQPFKTGPDFIDTGLHGIATGRASRNLDQWMCGPDYVVECFRRRAADVDIAVVEGVMGMYDGDCSTAGLALLLRAPVILVVDAYGLAESAGAIVQGFAGFGGAGEHPKIAGVIFNRVASENHYGRLKAGVGDARVLGYLPREWDFEIPHRHLGLTIAEEHPLAAGNIDKLADAVLRHIDVDAVIRNAEVRIQNSGSEFYRVDAKDAKDITNSARSGLDKPSRSSRLRGSAGFRLAIASDKAFSFYYEDNLDLLRDAGAEIIRFSPLDDPTIPGGADAVYIGGGYPELHAEALSRNSSLLASIREWADAGKPLYAECGGLMFLSQGIRDFDDRLFPMAGMFPFETRMLKRPRLGYREILLQEDCVLGSRGEKCRGHEFHYSEIAGGAAGSVYSMCDGRGKSLPVEGYRRKNTLASYVHVHFGSNRGIAGSFAAFVKGERTA